MTKDRLGLGLFGGGARLHSMNGGWMWLDSKDNLLVQKRSEKVQKKKKTREVSCYREIEKLYRFHMHTYLLVYSSPSD